MLQVDLPSVQGVGYLLLGLAALHALIAYRNWGKQDPTIVTHFSPKGGCTAAIITELATARSEILVQAYSFSCRDVADALISAVKRRVHVVVLLDRSNEQETYSELGDLKQHGVEVLIDACHAIAHNKVMVIDGRTVITGSFNFTRQAEHENAENLLILRNHPELASRYRANFHTHREHCKKPGAANNHAHSGHDRPRGPTSSSGHSHSGHTA
jgi:phosphatidylserine/phosphatidylglycerophosphate/cardiolipin synthase-like enzyme